jgi:hypothetical protein
MSEHNEWADGQHPSIEARVREIQGCGLKERCVWIILKDRYDHRLASNDPGSNGVAAVGVETFTSGCCPLRVPFRERPLPGAPPELGRTPSETVLRSWLMK